MPAVKIRRNVFGLAQKRSGKTAASEFPRLNEEDLKANTEYTGCPWKVSELCKASQVHSDSRFTKPTEHLNDSPLLILASTNWIFLITQPRTSCRIGCY